MESKNPLVKDLLMIIFRNEKYLMMCNVFNFIFPTIFNLLNLKLGYLVNSTVYKLKI